MRSLEVERGYLSSVQAPTATTATTAATSKLPLSPTSTTRTLSTTPTLTPTTAPTPTVPENPAVDLVDLLYLLRKDLNANAQCTIRIGELWSFSLSMFICFCFASNLQSDIVHTLQTEVMY